MIDGDAVVHDVVLAASPSEVFDMFVDSEKLIHWLGISAEVEPRPGGRFRFEVLPGQFCEGHYVAAERSRRVVFTWGWSDPAMGVPPGSSTVEVTIEPHGTTTRLRLVHRALPVEERGRLLHDDGWTRFLERLRAVVTGDMPPPYPAEQPAERLERLREGAAGETP